MRYRVDKVYVANIIGRSISAEAQVRGRSKALVLKNAKTMARGLGVTRIELFKEHNPFMGRERQMDLVTEYEYYEAVNGMTGWFDMNKNYPERRNSDG